MISRKSLRYSKVVNVYPIKIRQTCTRTANEMRKKLLLSVSFGIMHMSSVNLGNFYQSWMDNGESIPEVQIGKIYS